MPIASLHLIECIFYNVTVMQNKSGNHKYGYYLKLRKGYKKVDSDTDSSVPVLHPQELSKSSYR